MTYIDISVKLKLRTLNRDLIQTDSQAVIKASQIQKKYDSRPLIKSKVVEIYRDTKLLLLACCCDLLRIYRRWNESDDELRR